MSYTPPQGPLFNPGQPQYPTQPPQYSPPGGGYGYAPGPGQFPPPMQPEPPKRRTGLVAFLVVGALALIAGGGATYYFLGVDNEPGGNNVAEDQQTISSAEPDASESAAEITPCDLGYDELGLDIPPPGQTWSPVNFESGVGYVSEASVGCLAMHNDDHMSYIEVGTWPEASFYDPARLGESAAFVANAWGESEHVGGTDAQEKTVGAPDTGELEFDGHIAGWSEVRVTWTPAAGGVETFEDIAVLVIDIDGTTAFIAIASIPEVGEGMFEEATTALLSTRFTG
ncbi:hypothetical protein [Glycomyces sp. NPDC048151]|uniref:hypothetical protein n=1 Tax=Glycomyces sp. NPDC048151 TaxID=3364002 RepID=UPI003714353D